MITSLSSQVNKTMKKVQRIHEVNAGNIKQATIGPATIKRATIGAATIKRATIGPATIKRGEARGN